MDAETQHTPPPGTDFRWDDVRVVLALARAGTLKGAAARLGINATTVGRRLDAFEDAIGTRLFDRTPDGVRATESLERLLPQAAELEHAAADLSHAVQGFEREPEGVVRLTAPPGVAHLFVAPILVELHRRYPRLRLEVDASTGYADLTRREADIALRAVRPSAGDLVAARIAEQRSAILSSPEYAEELGTLDDPNSARWIDWGHDLAHIPGARWVASHVDPAAVILRTSNITTQIEAARTGLGVILAAPAVGEAAGLATVRPGRKLRAALREAPPEALWLVGHRALRNVPRIAAVWEFVLETVGSERLGSPRAR